MKPFPANDEFITRAAHLLRAGGLVAFPTETVYGLGADAANAAAVARIFVAKGRPSTNPLIVHVADTASAQRCSTAWPMEASKLAERFWPGALTMVLPKAATIVDMVTAGGATVGLRVPNHPVALALLRAFDGPIAAPSANRLNHISPTTAEHVQHEFGDSVDLILDGGRCEVGIESTVLDLSGTRPRILRPGGVSQTEIESVIGLVDVFTGSIDPKTSANSPGQQPRHYSPRTAAYRFDVNRREEWIATATSTGAAMLLIGERVSISPTFISMPTNPLLYARELYAVLRRLDEMKVSAIYIEMPPDTAAWHAVRDRIIRATREE